MAGGEGHADVVDDVFFQSVSHMLGKVVGAGIGDEGSEYTCHGDRFGEVGGAVDGVCSAAIDGNLCC